MAIQDRDDGLVIIIRRIPAQALETTLRSRLVPHLATVNIRANEFELQKPKGKGIATMHIASLVKGEAFLAMMKSISTTLQLGRHPIDFERHQNQDGGAMIRDTKFVEKVVADAYTKSNLEAKMSALDLNTPHPPHAQALQGQKAFSLNTISCGNWGYGSTGPPVFVSEYASIRPGKLLIGSRSIVAVLNHAHAPDTWANRIDFEWDFIDMIYTQKGRQPSLMITCKYAPRMYRPADLDIRAFLLKKPSYRTKARIPCLDKAHSEVAGSCLTYEFVFDSIQSLYAIRKLVEGVPDRPAAMRTSVATVVAKTPFGAALQDLNRRLSQSQLPFVVRFQALKLALNGHLAPESISDMLLSTVKKALSDGHSKTQVAEALRQLDKDLPWAGPQTTYVELQPKTVEALLQKIIKGNLVDSPTYRAIKNNDTLALIHHIQVTPAGYYLAGPEPEVTNRVLRKYKTHLDSFLRVTFSDEDGEPLQFRFDTSNDDVYSKFQAVLNDSIPLSGRNFEFLGFSQSSLRGQTAWFMSPFPTSKHGTVLTPAEAIKDLGDFSHLRSPAKCAARIGQAFTDTTGFVTVQAEAEFELPDVERNGRVFSDGCGTISSDLAYQVALKYPRFHMKVKPKLLQVRYRGCKGMLSVDPNLGDGQICVRPSMRKFETADTDTHNLEICGMGDKVRPMYLNRGLIKVLEDLGVPHDSFLAVAHETLQRLQGSTNSFLKAAELLDDERIGTAVGLPSLLRRMNEVGVDTRKDRMMCAVVEMAAFSRLRQMKYKGRILVKKGVKLMGIMDETGVLKEGEIHVAWVDENNRRKCHTGKVAVTRSPTNHPGDVQLAMAVDVPYDSPLMDLYNCVVFSQHGDRDLPSQLGGGDLDGDLYDVFWDPRLMPQKLFMPAEYPRLPTVDIGRQITTKDISKHFIDFMKNDNIGILANQLLIASDRAPQGTWDKDCLKISELMSTALDYPKTGIVANMKDLPRIDKSWRPDFMAPGPKVKIEPMNDPLEIIQEDGPEELPDDPVVALDPNERKTKYYECPNILGRLYRLVDEKGFYDQLQEQTKDFHRGQSALKDVLAYARRATAGFEFKQYLETAREIRATYEDGLQDISIDYALHSSHPLHEIEVVTGAVLGSIFVKKLQDQASDMKERFGRDMVYIRERIREDSEGGDEEAVERSMACLYVAVRERGKKMGRYGESRMWSFGYVAAGVCLEEIEKMHGGRLPAL